MIARAERPRKDRTVTRRHDSPRLLILALIAVLPSAAAGGSELCEIAARRAAVEYAVPDSLLLAIAAVETGREAVGSYRRPWPWTLNLAGESHWFTTGDLATTFLNTALAAGAERIDIGCFQLNLRWHGAAFDSPGRMLEPLANARHAARLLADLHRETGDWMLAAGVFHSRTAEQAARYRDRVARAMSPGPAQALQTSRDPGKMRETPMGLLRHSPRPGIEGLLRSPPGRLIGG